MNVRLLKAKRVECGLRQIDVAKLLHIAEKTMNNKECSTENRFTADEMLMLVTILSLTADEFNAIFFDGNLPKWISNKPKNYQTEESSSSMNLVCGRERIW